MQPKHWSALELTCPPIGEPRLLPDWRTDPPPRGGTGNGKGKGKFAPPRLAANLARDLPPVGSIVVSDHSAAAATPPQPTMCATNAGLLLHFFPKAQRPYEKDYLSWFRRGRGLATGICRDDAGLQNLFRRECLYGQPRKIRGVRLA